LFEVVDIEPVAKDDRHSATTGSRSSSIELSNITFSYPNQNIPALQDLSFSVPAGKAIAIVGPSGAGKSTVANLLLRFWDYKSGEISLGGESLKALNQEEVRKRCALVSQNSYFFNTSIRENLRLARPSLSQEEMESAARAAQIHDFISSLPKGYDTFIGEQGLRLSGGERQRLAIARVLLKDAPILILDEPTANLDLITEKQLLYTLFAVMRERTSLLITHRLVGLENVDEILVMEDGRVNQRGRHHELLAAGGLYRRLWDLQNQIPAEAVHA
jgi:ABC-type multidrug transport system fused ATPase/permease subunit